MNAFKSALCAAVLVVCATAEPARAQQQSTTTFEVVLVVESSCTFVSATNVNFGNTTVVPGDVRDAFGSLRVRCNDLVPYLVSLDQGLHGSGVNDRRMLHTNGTDTDTDTIAYQLYSGDAGTASCNEAAGVQWGNASAGCVYSDTYAGTEQDIEIYGKLTMGNPRAGSYSDTITATITY